MRAWLLLLAAIVSEVTASLSLKAALDRPWLYVVVLGGYTVSLFLLAAILRAGMPLGVAYGIWGALGVVATAALSAVLFDEALTGTMMIGIALVIAGVLVVEFGSQRAAAGPATSSESSTADVPDVAVGREPRP